jgi:hypothetical protein
MSVRRSDYEWTFSLRSMNHQKPTISGHLFDTGQAFNSARVRALRILETRAWRTPMKKILLSLSAALIIVAGFATSADAQRVRGGAGFYRGGGGGFVGGPGRVGFVGGPGIRRAGFVGGPGIRRAGFVGGPGVWGGRRWVGGPGWWGGRRFVGAGLIGAGLVGAGAYYGGYGYGGGCRQWQMVGTPWGPQWQLVNVCFAPVGYGYGPVGYYGAGVY